MLRQPFYNISKSAYLFSNQHQPAVNDEGPEEPVRQWCAYELIRAYGILISELEFEHAVRVGSKFYRIDILVSCRGVPWVVVECKEPGHTKPADGIAQAISYADSQDIQAEFVVYTNGKVWQVQRRIRGQWVPVPDLPQHITDPGGEPITDILSAIHNAAPLLYELDDTIDGDDAQKLLSAMQVFFCGINLLTQDADRDLLFATDNLLRVLSAEADVAYQIGKFETAARHYYEQYRQRTGLGSPISDVTGQDPLCVEMQYLHAALLSMIEGTTNLTAADGFVLRLDAALAEYGRSRRDPKIPYPKIGPSLHHALRDYLNYALAIRLNTILPDPLDNVLISDMKSSCHYAWQQFESQP